MTRALRASLLAAAVRAGGRSEPAALARDLLADDGPPLAPAAPAPSRPAAVPPGRWRRMSRLARLATTCAVEVLEATGTPPDDLAVAWGTAVGELATTHRFLDRVLRGEAAQASPLAFQNSVYNAVAGHLAMALDLRGASETVAAGGATCAATCLRAALLLARGAAGRVLVLVGEEGGPDLARANRAAGLDHPAAEVMAALLLAPPDTPGAIPLAVGTGTPPAPPLLARHAALPLEPPAPAWPPPGARAPERVLGLAPASGGAGLAALSALPGGGVLAERDGSTRWWVALGPPARRPPPPQ